MVAPEVMEAMEEAASGFVDLDRLLIESGRHLAGLLECEAALVTAGAAAGLSLAAAACMAGTDPARIAALPDTRGLRDEFVIPRTHRNPYDQAIRTAGGRMVEIGSAIDTSPWELKAALGEDTAAVLFFAQSALLEASPPLRTVLEVAHGRGIPVIVDAAAELPPADNLRRFTGEGADLVLFSGGKDLRGPQGTGLMLGREDLVSAARLHGPPHHAVGRPMKVDKESVMGLVRAVELYLEEDHGERKRVWEGQVERIGRALSAVEGLGVETGHPVQPYCQPAVIPRVFISFGPGLRQRGLNAAEAVRLLRSGDPPVAAMSRRGVLHINPHMLEPGEEEIIIHRLREIAAPGK